MSHTFENGPSDWFEKTTKNEDWGGWVYQAMGSDDPVPVRRPPTEEQMIKDILEKAEDKDFFREIVAWLKNDAPKKLRPALQELHGIRRNPIKYEWLCELVYNLNFRASEKIEQRMILGQANEWVKKYFQDFPPK